MVVLKQKVGATMGTSGYDIWVVWLGVDLRTITKKTSCVEKKFDSIVNIIGGIYVIF